MNRTSSKQQPFRGRNQGIPSLEIQSTLHGGKLTYNLTKPVINIGRDRSNDIVIDAPVVSGFHAQIVREGDQLILVHPHPSRPHTINGLLYQGRHILGNEPFRKPLVRDDTFRIGNEHGAQVTLTYHDGSGALQEIVPAIRPLPAGAPVIIIGSQPQSPQAQPQGKQQVQTHQHQPQPKKPHNVNEQQATNKSNKKRNLITSAVITAVITAVATIMAAWINVHPVPPGPTPTPAPTQVSIPRLHSSYTGSYSVTRVSPGYNKLPSGPITFFSIKEGDQGQVQSGMTLSNGDYTCQGSVDTGRNLVLSCTLVSDTHIHVEVNGQVSQDEGHLSGTWHATDSNDLSFYMDATWSAQG